MCLCVNVPPCLCMSEALGRAAPLTVYFRAICSLCSAPLLVGSWVPSFVLRGTCKLLRWRLLLSASPPPCLIPCPQSHSQQMLTWTLVTEGNFSLKLDIGATPLSAFSPNVLYEDIQVENMRTFSRHLVCALKSQVHEYFFCSV